MNVEKFKEGIEKIATAILKPFGEVIGKVILILLAFVVLGFIVECIHSGPTQEYYGLLNNVPAERVTVIPQPHDCDFSKAPIGDKECHYERVVSKSSDSRGYYLIVDWRRVNE